MIREKIISVTSKLSFILVVVFVYWMFISIFHEILGLRVFDDDWYVTAFYTVTGGILALLAVFVILNIVLTLTKSGKNKICAVLFILSFPVIIGLMYLVDLEVSRFTEKELLNFAKKIVAENKDIMESLGEYRYDLSYLRSVDQFLESLGENKGFFVKLIDKDDEENRFIALDKYIALDELPEKSFITHYCSEEEHEYLQQVFSGENEDYLFTSHKLYRHLFMLYYPVQMENRLIVLYLWKSSSLIDVESDLRY